MVSVADMAMFSLLIPAAGQVPLVKIELGIEVYRKGLSGKSTSTLLMTDW